MKDKLKWVTIAVAAAAVFITAGQPVPNEKKVQVTREKESGIEKCYSESEVQLLMQANEWTEMTAREVLELSCDHAVSTH